MSSFVVLWRRELTAHLLSPLIAAVAVAVAAVTGLSLWRVLAEGDSLAISLPYGLFQVPAVQTMLFMVVAVVSMGSFAEEKRSGTVECLLTAPVGEVSIVLAKFAGAMSLFLLIFAPTAVYPILLRMVSSYFDPLDLARLAMGYAILLLVGGLFVSIGLLLSSLTKQPAVAVIGTFTVASLLFHADAFADALFFGSLRRLVEAGCSSRHVADFCSGILDTRVLVYYLTVSAFMLFATVKALEARRWN